jgi:hypothetical protein
LTSASWTDTSVTWLPNASNAVCRRPAHLRAGPIEVELFQQARRLVSVCVSRLPLEQRLWVLARLDAREESGAHLRLTVDLAGAAFAAEFRIRVKSGGFRWITSTGRVFRDAEGTPKRMLGLTIDCTERRTLEDRVRQAQKMEAVGRLAGGIAHDFNNLLTAINGFTSLALARLPDESPVREELVEVAKAGQRATQLTGQLLAFSRKQILSPRSLDLNRVVGDISAMIRSGGWYFAGSVRCGMSSERTSAVFVDTTSGESSLGHISSHGRLATSVMPWPLRSSASRMRTPVCRSPATAMVLSRIVRAEPVKRAS